MRSPRALACFLLAPPTIGFAFDAPDRIQTVGIYKLDDQRLSGETTVTAKESSFGDLSVLVTIDTSGRVVAAEAVDNYQKLDTAPALRAVRSWTFRPQHFNGTPVNAVGRVSVSYAKPPIPPDPKAVFPSANSIDFSITLRRGACYGTCPDYSVTLHGDGLVEFDTDGDSFKGKAAEVHLEYNGHNVLMPGRHTARIDPAAAARLLGRFRDARFFGLKSAYSYGATDASTQELTVRVGKTTKTVTDYIGTMAGMPQAVRDLEDEVDAVAGTDRWVAGNLATIDLLQASGFDFRSQKAATLAAAAMARFDGYRQSSGVEQLLLGLVERGAPLGARIGSSTLGAVLVRAAAARGSETLFGKLADRGALSLLQPAALSDAFVHVGCSPPIARALVKAGADPRSSGEDGTALTALRGATPSCEGRPDGELEMARTLIGLGVPLEARDSLGWTALMGCDSPELAKLLLAGGANPNARDEDGTTPLLSTDDDRVALILLRAGADPRVRDKNGSLRTQARKGYMPATLAWLDAHGVP